MKQIRDVLCIAAAVAVFVVFLPCRASAHCDTLDGPVIIEAKTALEKGDVTPVLKWVRKEDEKEVKDLFNKTIAVRKQGKEVRDIVDIYFFETLVRIHRAGEGAPYTGLKPAGMVEPSVAAADKAIGTGSADTLVKMISDAAANGIHERFARVKEAKKHADHSVEAGRAFVGAYVEFTHYVERLHLDSIRPSGHAKQEGAGMHEHQHH